MNALRFTTENARVVMRATGACFTLTPDQARETAKTLRDLAARAEAEAREKQRHEADTLRAEIAARQAKLEAMG